MKRFNGSNGTKRMMELIRDGIRQKEDPMEEFTAEEISGLLQSNDGSDDFVYNESIGYTIKTDELSNTITLKKYMGSEEDIVVQPTYDVDGIVYTTKLDDDSSNMFSDNSSIKTVTFADGIDSSNVTNIDEMFKNDTALTDVDMGYLDLSNITSADSTFENTPSLNEVLVNDTYNIDNDPYMFVNSSISHVTVLSTEDDASSTAGITWTKAWLPVSAQWYKVIYADNKFIAISYGPYCAYSTDGIQWTQSVFSVISNAKGITYGNGKFLALGYNYGWGAYSEDGITWEKTGQISSQNKFTWADCTYGAGKFLAMSEGGLICSSEDGITWSMIGTLMEDGMMIIGTTITKPQTRTWNVIKYVNNRFIAIGGGTTNYPSNTIAWSDDGIEWTTVSITDPFKYVINWSGIAYGNGTYIVTGEFGYVMHSTDGITWSISRGLNGGTWSAAYGAGKFIAVESDSDDAAYSTDGITWTFTTLPTDAYWTDVVYGNRTFVAVARTTYAAYSI